MFCSNSQQLRLRVEADCRGRVGESMVGSLKEEGREKMRGGGERESERGKERGEGTYVRGGVCLR